jgi:hypothetical protein
MFKIPFKWLPAAWGLKGKAYKQAEAYYNFKEGETLDRKLLDIEFDGQPPEEKVLALDKKYGKLSSYDYDLELIEQQDLDLDSKNLAILEVKKKHGKIQDFEYRRDKAEIEQEPWVDIIDHGFDPEQMINGFYMSFAWNSHWIDLLRRHGYNGKTEEEIIDQWYTDVCNSQVQSVLDGKEDE